MGIFGYFLIDAFMKSVDKRQIAVFFEAMFLDSNCGKTKVLFLLIFIIFLVFFLQNFLAALAFVWFVYILEELISSCLFVFI